MLFISYSHRDKEIADSLLQELKKFGFSSWQVFKDDDPRNGIRLGTDWEQELLTNLKGVTVLIVLVSPAWFESKWCFAELALCKTKPHNVRIIPLVIDDLTDEQWIKSGLVSRQKTNIRKADFATEVEAIRSFVADLADRGIRPESSRGRLADSYADSHSYRHRTYEQWGLDPNMKLSLVADQNQQNAIDAIRSKLGGEPTERIAHLHIHGSSGIGKTRVVFEALSDNRFRSKVLYYNSPESFLLDPYLQRLRRDDAADIAILVVDDCLRTNPEELARRVEPIKDRVQIVTISFDRPTDQRDNYIELLPIDTNGIQKIIESYLSKEQRGTDRLADLCNGSSRYAHLLGQAAKSDQSILDVSDGRDLGERIVPCGAPRDSETAKNRLTVARFLALFERFGAAAPYEQELEEIAKIIRKFHPKIGLGDVVEAVRALHQARIIQGRSTYYFAVPLMAHELWCSWWSIYGEHWKLLPLMGLSESLFDVWLRRLRSMDHTSITKHMSERIMGWLQHQTVLGYSGFIGNISHRVQYELLRRQNLLKSIFDLVPKRALDLLSHEISLQKQDSPEHQPLFNSLQLFESDIIRQSIVPGLEFKAVELLWQIELGRKVPNSDYESGRRLGSHLAWNANRKSSQGFYEETIRFLRTKIGCQCNRERIVVLNILFQAFQDTKSQSADAGRYADSLWKLGVESLSSLKDIAEAKPLFKNVARCLQRFFAFPDYAESWVDAIHWLGKTDLQTRSLFLSDIESLWLQSNEFFHQEAVRGALQRLYRMLLGDCEEAVRETVFLTTPNIYDNDDKESLESLFCRKDAIRSICESIAVSPERFGHLLSRAVGSQDTLFEQGFCLGQLDNSRNAFRLILTLYDLPQAEGYMSLLLGYLSAVSKLDSLEAQSLSDDALAISWSPESRLRLSMYLAVPIARIEDELLSALKDSTIHRKFFWWLSRECIGLMTEHKLLEIINEYLKQSTIEALESAVWLFHERYQSAEKVSAAALAALKKLVLFDALFQDSSSAASHDSNLHTWKQCFAIQAKFDPAVCSEFARRYWKFYLESPYGQIGTISEALVEAIKICTREAPQYTWDVFFHLLESSETAKQHSLIDWLLTTQHIYVELDARMWEAVPIHRLFEWAEVQQDVRLPIIASRLPPLIVGDSMVSVTREFYLKYGNYHPELEDNWNRSRFGYSIPGLEEIRSVLATAVELRDNEADPNVFTLLDREIERLCQLQERTKEQEEIDRERRLH